MWMNLKKSWSNYLNSLKCSSTLIRAFGECESQVSMNSELTDFLKGLKQFGIENDIPNVTERGGRFLNMLVQMTGSKSGLEIGSANGYSTIWLAEAFRNNNGKLKSIDFSQPTHESAKENLNKAGLSDVVEFYFGNALEVIKAWNDQRFDFVFVDGEKRSYWDFWEVIQPFLADRAVIAFDDVLSFPEKTKPFMEKIKNVLGFDQVVLPIDKDDGVLLMTKTN